MTDYRIECNVERVLAEIGGTDRGMKRLTLTSWNGNPAKLDLRPWTIEPTGKALPGKGLTLTDAEARALCDALCAYFGNDCAERYSAPVTG